MSTFVLLVILENFECFFSACQFYFIHEHILEKNIYETVPWTLYIMGLMTSRNINDFAVPLFVKVN